MKTFYSIKDLTFKYNKSDFNININDLDIKKGEFTCIIGPNGSGKSTFLKMCAGVEKKFIGQIKVLNKNINEYKRKEFAKRVSFLPQEVSLVNDYIVNEVVMMGRYPHQKNSFFTDLKDKKIVESSLNETGALKFIKREFSSLSGGEKKKVLISSILAQESDFLLLDEPTSSLDINSQSEIFSILAKIKNNDKGVVVSTHNINLASMYSNKIILFSNGKIIKQGMPLKVIKKDILLKAYGKNIDIIDHPHINERKIVLPKIDDGMIL